MSCWTQRTELLIGKEGLEQLKNSTVLIVGLGGVGGMAAEAICRAGVGNITLVDRDIVTETNINRQLIALHSTIGQTKTNVLESRLKDINPDVNIHVVSDWLDENTMTRILTEKAYDYVVDAIDTLSPKVYLLKTCVENGLKVVSAMGAGAKMDPTKVKIDDISKSNHCPLAKAVRKRLQKKGIKKGIQVVYSTEDFHKNSVIEAEERYKKSTTGTISYMPNLFGLMAASVVIKDLAI